MPDHPVSRRTVAVALAGGIVGAKLAAVASSEGALGEADHAGAPPGAPERHLLSPLAAGARLLTWEVVSIDPLDRGAVRVNLRGEGGVTFGVEILARDASPLAARPPARTERFALHVSNGGDGRMPTVEDQGLAAMALAQIVANNEASVSAAGFLTHSARLSEHGDALIPPV